VAPILFWPVLAKPEEVPLLLPLHRDICATHQVPGGELNRLPTIENGGYDVRC
jgi:hypothetical protein